jgi:hypothetical protein
MWRLGELATPLMPSHAWKGSNQCIMSFICTWPQAVVCVRHQPRDIAAEYLNNVNYLNGAAAVKEGVSATLSMKASS